MPSRTLPAKRRALQSRLVRASPWSAQRAAPSPSRRYRRQPLKLPRLPVARQNADQGHWLLRSQSRERSAAALTALRLGAATLDFGCEQALRLFVRQAFEFVQQFG